MKRAIFLFVCLLNFATLSAESFQFHLTDYDRSAIHEIISSMGEKNLARLLLESRHLSDLGASIDHVPPLEFVGFILIDPYLKKNLKKVSKSYFKWSSFIDGFGTRMEKEHSHGTILPQLPSFAKLVGGDLHTLEAMTHREDWDGFIKSLL